jgi:hypothetical protein
VSGECLGGRGSVLEGWGRVGEGGKDRGKSR